MTTLRVVCAALFFKGCVLLVAYLWASHLPHTRALTLCQFDCGYYVEIARQGYQGFDRPLGPAAFYPLYPLLLRGVALFTGYGAALEWGALLLNAVLFAGALFLFLSWAERKGLRDSWLLVLLLSVDRNSIWFFMPYTETLFLLVAALFCWSELRARTGKNYLALGALAAVGACARLVALAFVGALGLSRWREFVRRPLLGLSVLLVALSGLGLFALHLRGLGAHPLLPLQVQHQWGRDLSLMGSVQNYLALLTRGYFPTSLYLLLLSVAWLRPPRAIQYSAFDRWTSFFYVLMPIATGLDRGFTRFLSVLPQSYLVALGFLQPFLHVAKRRRLLLALLLFLCAAEAFQQICFLRDMLRGHNAAWVG